MPCAHTINIGDVILMLIITSCSFFTQFLKLLNIIFLYQLNENHGQPSGHFNSDGTRMHVIKVQH